MTTARPSRRLFRSRSDRMLGGVAGGVAAYLQVDPALTRLVFALLILAGGAGLLLYVVACFVIPEEPLGDAAPPAGSSAPADAANAAAPLLLAAPTAPPPTEAAASGRRNVRLLVGVCLVAFGTLLLLDWALPDLEHFLWPGAIIAVGLGLLAYGVRR